MAIARHHSALTPIPFDKQLVTAGTPEDLVTIPAGKRGVRIHLSVLVTNARLGFDATAGPTELRVGNGDVYQDEVTIRERVSFVGDPGGKPRIYGVVWCE